MQKLKLRRDRTEIIADILRIAKKGARRTRIVYRANLNFTLLDNNYLPSLIKKGLVMFSNERMIKTTEKGLEYLQHFNHLSELVC